VRRCRLRRYRLGRPTPCAWPAATESPTRSRAARLAWAAQVRSSLSSAPLRACRSRCIHPFRIIVRRRRDKGLRLGVACDHPGCTGNGFGDGQDTRLLPADRSVCSTTQASGITGAGGRNAARRPPLMRFFPFQRSLAASRWTGDANSRPIPVRRTCQSAIPGFSLWLPRWLRCGT
jgi:hypothetical protein